MPKRSILLLAGEASGDYHAAALVRDLKAADPEIRVSGIGGDKLAAAGMELIHHYRDINTIGLSEGLSKVRNIFKAYGTMKRELRSGVHDLFIPVDFPDVNLRLCKVAKDAAVPVCYYISPQVWAWRKGRIRKIAARVDRMMTIFPFEEKLFRDAGVKADFVGHTMAKDVPHAVDKVPLRIELGMDRQKWAVALLPGSRPDEVRRMLPVMCEAARLHMEKFADTQFVLPLAGAHLNGIVNEILDRHGTPVTVHSTDAAKLMAACDAGLVTSGTATLQAALAGMPHAVVYKLDRFTWLLAIKILKPLVMDKDVHVAIANVLAIGMEKEGRGPIEQIKRAGYSILCQECGRPLFVPELLQDQATAENLAEWLMRFRTDETLRIATISGFEQIRNELGPPEEDRTPVAIVLDCLENRRLQETC
ncbi:MAG: lipid-A-disaccharide synthase [Desulfomonile tiedjei]|nr:lipid-A-disaccharide synthase [Desulfomonile tiedjei]